MFEGIKPSLKSLALYAVPLIAVVATEPQANQPQSGAIQRPLLPPLVTTWSGDWGNTIASTLALTNVSIVAGKICRSTKRTGHTGSRPLKG